MSSKRSMTSAFGIKAFESPSSKVRVVDSNNVHKKTEPMRLFRQVTGSDMTSVLFPVKIINDPVHQNIQIDAFCLRIIDSPEYQRLSKLKQLGTCSYVFRSATHTRLEHSIGVAHLAEKVARNLQKNQPNLNITEIDILCVKVAGLCHDLGHGPFSHVYDGVFIKAMYPNGIDGKGKKWRHEDGSVAMLRHLIKKNSINVADFGLKHIDILFIEEIIGGVKGSDRKGRMPEKSYLYDIVNNTRSGLDVDKLDYYQRDMRQTNVVLNASFERFIELGRVYEAATTEKDCPGKTEYATMICYPEKLVREAVDLFNVRFRMHHYVYGHKSVKEVEYMITDALMIANPYIKVPGSKKPGFEDGLYRISECIFDMEAFSKLNDSILDIILYDPNPLLQPAHAILNRISTRQLYVCLGKSSFRRGDNIDRMSEEEIKQEILRYVTSDEKPMMFDDFDYLSSHDMISISTSNDPSTLGYFEESDDPRLTHTHVHLSQDNSLTHNSSNIFSNTTPSDSQTTLSPDFNDDDVDARMIGSTTLSSNRLYHGGVEKKRTTTLAEDLIVEKMHIHYGLKEANPVKKLRFFGKRDTEDTRRGREIPESAYETSLPRTFEEQAVRVFCRNVEWEQKGREAFEMWCQHRKAPTPFPSLSQGGDDLDHQLPKRSKVFQDEVEEAVLDMETENENRYDEESRMDRSPQGGSNSWHCSQESFPYSPNI